MMVGRKCKDGDGSAATIIAGPVVNAHGALMVVLELSDGYMRSACVDSLVLEPASDGYRVACKICDGFKDEHFSWCAITKAGPCVVCDKIGDHLSIDCPDYKKGK